MPGAEAFGDFGKLPRDMFTKVTDLVSTQDLLTMRSLSSELKSGVAGYLKGSIERGSIVDGSPPYGRIDSGLDDSKILKMIFDGRALRKELPDAVAGYEQAVRDGLENPETSKVDVRTWDVWLISRFLKIIGQEQNFAVEMTMRGYLHEFVESCLARDALVDKATGRPVTGMSVDDALEKWSGGEINYDLDAKPYL